MTTPQTLQVSTKYITMTRNQMMIAITCTVLARSTASFKIRLKTLYSVCFTATSSRCVEGAVVFILGRLLQVWFIAVTVTLSL